MANQIKRFERWHQKLPPEPAFLVSQVCNQVLPRFVDAGFVRLDTYGGPNNLRASLGRSIALQHQSGTEWPTVELHFFDLRRPCVVVNFAWLPDPCFRFRKAGTAEIPRTDALVSHGSVFFRLRKGPGRSNDTFGIPSLIWPPVRRVTALRSEVDQLERCCGWLIDLLSRDMPPEWGMSATPNRVHACASRIGGALASRRPPQQTK